MELKILNEEENKLFNRKEVRFEVVHEGDATPKLIDVRRTLARKTGSDTSHVVVDGFKTLFGIGRTIGDARIYKDMDELKDYEPTYLLKRNSIIDNGKPEEKKEEAPKQEVKVEDKGEASGEED